jgi:hypothetical protein
MILLILIFQVMIKEAFNQNCKIDNVFVTSTQVCRSKNSLIQPIPKYMARMGTAVNNSTPLRTSVVYVKVVITN